MEVDQSVSGVDSSQAGSETTSATNISRGPLLPDNPDDTKCYCGKERDLSVAEFQCGMCLRFYHTQCIECPIGECIPFMTNYQFFCKRCSVQESLNKRMASFGQKCLTALANLSQRNPDCTFFSKDRDLIPFIEDNWEKLTTGPRKVKQTWHTTIAKTMMKDPAIFQYQEDASGETVFGLMNLDLLKIGPNCESLFRLTNASFRNTEVQKPSAADSKGRTAKRKGPVDGPILKHKRGDVSSTRTAPKAYPLEHPFNKDGYRYILAEPDPHAPNWQAYDDSIEWAGKPIPPYLYRMYLEPNVLLAMHDRAPQLKLSEDRLTVTGDKGYSMIRGTHSVHRGTWYFEVTVKEMTGDSATRLGWCQKLGNLQAPCGYDKFSYSWRSRKGTVFHESRGKHFSEAFVAGDVLGFMIHLPMNSDAESLLPPPYKDDPLVKFKSLLYYEEKDYIAESEKNLKTLKNSRILLFKNGKFAGVAFSDIYDGSYFPAASLYKNAAVTMNFGPTFTFDPVTEVKFQPYCNVVEKAYVDHALGDIVYHIEHEGQLPEF